MAEHTAIEWTDATCSPVIGCTHCSAGCENCWAPRQAVRLSAPGRKYAGLTVATKNGPKWNGQVRLVEKDLTVPLAWKTPRRIFVCDMGDLFHEDVPDEWIDVVWGVMMLAERHTFQILTKRAERMRAYLQKLDVRRVARATYQRYEHMQHLPAAIGGAHIWLGVSVEDQATADARIPELLATPAAVRWVSYEPALGPVDFNGMSRTPGAAAEEITAEDDAFGPPLGGVNGIDWIVVGGESGPRSRPFDIAWARQTIAQCREAKVAVFAKQMGRRPRASDLTHWRCPAELMPDGNGYALELTDSKGGDLAEWPEDLRVREFPS